MARFVVNSNFNFSYIEDVCVGSPTPYPLSSSSLLQLISLCSARWISSSFMIIGVLCLPHLVCCNSLGHNDLIWWKMILFLLHSTLSSSFTMVNAKKMRKKFRAEKQSPWHLERKTWKKAHDSTFFLLAGWYAEVVVWRESSLKLVEWETERRMKQWNEEHFSGRFLISTSPPFVCRRSVGLGEMCFVRSLKRSSQIWNPISRDPFCLFLSLSLSISGPMYPFYFDLYMCMLRNHIKNSFHTR